LTTVCLPQSPLSSIHSDVQSIPSPSHARRSTAGDALISVITPAARRAGETSHGVLFNVQRTVKTLELLRFQNRQQRGIKSRFRFDTVLWKNRGFGTDFDNRNKTSSRMHRLATIHMLQMTDDDRRTVG